MHLAGCASRSARSQVSWAEPGALAWAPVDVSDELRERLWERLRAALGDHMVLNGHPELRLPNTLNVNFVGKNGADLLQAVPEIAASTGSACHEGSVSLSPVLAAMGVPVDLGRGAVRLSVGRFTTEDEIDRAAAALVGAVGRIA